MSLYVATGFSDVNVENLFKVGVTVNLNRRLGQYHKHHSGVRFIASKPICENRTFHAKDENDRTFIRSIECDFLNLVRSIQEFHPYKGLYGTAKEWFIGDVAKAVDVLRMFQPSIQRLPIVQPLPLRAFFTEVLGILKDTLLVEYPSDDIVLEDIDKFIHQDSDKNDWTWFDIPNICELYRITETSNPTHVALLLGMMNRLIRYSTEADDIICEMEVETNMRFLGIDPNKQVKYLYKNMSERTRTNYLDALHKNIFRICDQLQGGSPMNLENKLQQMLLLRPFFEMFQDKKNHHHQSIFDLSERLEEVLVYDGHECDDDFRFMMLIADTFSKRFINRKLLSILGERNQRSSTRNLLEWIEYADHFVETDENDTDTDSDDVTSRVSGDTH